MHVISPNRSHAVYRHQRSPAIPAILVDFLSNRFVMQSKASFVLFVTMRISSVLVSLAVWSVDFAKWSDPTTNKEHGMEFSEIPFSMLFFHMWGTFRQNSNRITQQSWVSSDGTNHRKAKEFTCRDVVGKVPDWGGVKLESGNCLHVFFPHKFLTYFDTSHVFYNVWWWYIV